MATRQKRLQQENIYDVEQRKWRNWPDLCQRVFNDVYTMMLVNQDLCLHPKAKPSTITLWTTTAWNAAWMAADAAQRALKDIIKAKGYAE